MIAECIVLAVVLLAITYAAWDVARRRVEAAKFNEPTLSRLATAERELERLQDQQRKTIERLSSMGAGVVSRLPGRAAR